MGTSNHNFDLPQLGADASSWGAKLNAVLTAMDGLFVPLGGKQTKAGGGVMPLTGVLVGVTPAAAGQASFRLPHGVQPTGLADGDLWSTAAGLNFRLNGAVKGVAFLEGASFTGRITAVQPAAGAGGFASLRLPHGSAPTTNLGNGDLWTTDQGLYVQINGATVGPLAALNPVLQDLGGLSQAADRGLYFDTATTAATFPLTSAGRALLDDVDAAAQRATLGLRIGTDVQAHDVDLAAIAALASAADRTPYATGAGTWAMTTLTAFARGLLDDTDAAAMRATLGVAPPQLSAVGVVTGAGSVNGASTGVSGASHPNTGRYVVTLANAPTLAAATVTAVSAGSSLIATVTSFSGATVNVEFKNGAGSYADPDSFTIMVAA
ncbi:MAG: hypothetical protein K1X35_09935 [Caulobacteraceae bacterium]|nr:hypothetical protein [Caulobacteraceae bacterium]